ncbi:putative membrane protein [Halapricum desulfuricans]|uniref:Putative membrane protein n=1 Tax=Halapricum desulfuricans TaxID=2841257 RepID=A0A897NE87_9EURY|nr:heliorhodopsin HeR [Halapricum desulfuricans]QSG10997.1 putative membrane protein [Halapricum desulfuricans]
MSTASTTATGTADATSARDTRLRLWNSVMAVLHFLQGVAMVVLADEVLWPITRTRYGFNAETETIFPTTVSFIDANLPLLVAGFLFISALAHTAIATVLYERYIAYLDRGMNPYRWYEYAVSASLMIVVIGMLAGVWDLGTLVALFGLVAVMNLAGLLMEQRNESAAETDWTPYWVGVLAGIVPWIVIGITFIGTVTASGGEFPEFVIYIYVSIFVFFNLFALNMALQYLEVSRWKDYLFGEKMYVLLSLVAKSVLAWQVYFGTLNSPI